MFEGGEEAVLRVAGIGPAGWLRPSELLRNCERAVAAQSYFEWVRYDTAAQLHRQVVAPFEDTPVALRAVDPFSVCAAQLGAAQQMTQQGAEHYLTRALALRDRLPQVKQMLREGHVAAHHIAEIISRTDLIDGSQHMAAIDADIAEQLRRRGSWSRHRMRDMVDTMIMLRDPDLVREHRKDAKNRRGVWNNDIGDGMSAIDAVGSAEETGLIMARLEKLAMSVCKADPRRKSERMADALFALVMAREFSCECPKDPKHRCTATITTWPAGAMVSGVDVKLVLHVIADQATVDGNADHPGYLHGHGVISGDRVRDIADRSEVVQRPMRNEYEQSESRWDDSDLRAEAEYSKFYAAEHDAAAASTPVQDPPHPATAETEPTPEPVPEVASGTETVAEPPVDPAATPARDNDQNRTKVHSRAPQRPAPPHHDRPRTPDATPESETGVKAEGEAPARPAAAPDDLAIPWYDQMLAEAAAPPRWQAIPLPIVQPGDHYRPSTVVDDYLRIRDLYCMWPGCEKTAWTADLDHTDEYNHHDPDAGGHTHPDGMKTLCRFHHLIKTYSAETRRRGGRPIEWLDDQYPDQITGRTCLVFTTPGGRTYGGPAWTGDDLFPGLRHIVFDDWDNRPDFGPRIHKSPPPPHTRQHTRTQAKHTRRQQERLRNRQHSASDPPPF